MPRIQSHRDLIVWQKALDAVASVPANIAEGHARTTRRDYANFLTIARGSLAETETFLLLAKRLGYIDENALGKVLALLDEVGRMLMTLRKRLLGG